MRNDKQPRNSKQLFYEGSLDAGAEISLPKDMARRMARVLRLRKGDVVTLFNGEHGLFAAEIMDDDAKNVRLIEKLKDQPQNRPVYLLIAMTKKDAMDRVLRQATEFGVTDIVPVKTDYAVADKLNEDRVRALILEAAEQCERLTIPTLHLLTALEKAIETCPGRVFWCAEHIGGYWAGGKAAAEDGLLVGPEGGFSERERDMLLNNTAVTPVGLGEHILRVDTAVVAGLSRLYENLPT